MPEMKFDMQRSQTMDILGVMDKIRIENLFCLLLESSSSCDRMTMYLNRNARPIARR